MVTLNLTNEQAHSLYDLVFLQQISDKRNATETGDLLKEGYLEYRDLHVIYREREKRAEELKQLIIDAELKEKEETKNGDH